MKWFLAVLKKDDAFSGRARRKEFWFFALFVHVFLIVLLLIEYLFFHFFDVNFIGYFSGFYALAMIIPWITVSIRRLHDTGLSGYWLFFNFVPIVGQIWFFIKMIQEGTLGENKYGLNPKSVI